MTTILEEPDILDVFFAGKMCADERVGIRLLCWMLARDKSKDDDFRIPVGVFTPRYGRGRNITDKTLIKNTFIAHKFNNQQNM